jgi:hypothetical protein
VAGQCTDYTNVATIEETAQSDQQVVTVCGTFTGGGGGTFTGGGGGGTTATPTTALPRTGFELTDQAAYGAALVLAGLGALLLAPRRRAVTAR